MNIEIIKQAVKIEVEREVKKAIEAAKDELDRRVPEVVAGLSIKIMERVSFERMQNELVIHVQMPDISSQKEP